MANDHGSRPPHAQPPDREQPSRAELEDRLRKSEQWFRQVIDLVPHFVFAKDRNGRFVLANRAVAEAYGTTVEELLGRGDADYASSGGEVSAFLEADRRVIDSGQPLRIPEEQITDASGKVRWLETTKVPFILATTGEPGVLGVSTDITARRLLEAEFRQAQKMEAVGRLAGGIAHDFNNLLTAILGFTTSVVDDFPGDDPRRHDLEDVIGAARRAADLTRQLLAFSRRQVLQPRVLDLNAVVGDLQRLLGRIVGEDIQLVTRLGPALPPVLADQGQVEQVVLNLCVNAREAMPNGGRLTIETSSAPSDGGAVAWVRVRVSDTGIGMAPDQVGRIFEPFFTTKEGGTGLGLAVVYGIVQQSGGKLVVESMPDRGTSIDMYLPTTDRPFEADVAPPARIDRPVAATILLAEDEDAVRRLARRVLERQGYRVLEAANGEEALRIADSFIGSIDLLVSDVVMPKMNGRDLAAALTGRRPDTRVVLMSGYTTSNLGADSRGRAFPFLQKPFDGPALLAIVARALGAPA